MHETSRCLLSRVPLHVWQRPSARRGASGTGRSASRPDGMRAQNRFERDLEMVDPYILQWLLRMQVLNPAGVAAYLSETLGQADQAEVLHQFPQDRAQLVQSLMNGQASQGSSSAPYRPAWSQHPDRLVYPPTHHPAPPPYPAPSPHRAVNPGLSAPVIPSPQLYPQHFPTTPLPSVFQGPPQPLQRPHGRSGRPTMPGLPGGRLIMQIDNSRYAVRHMARPGAPPTLSSGACAAITAQFLNRSFLGGGIATNLGGQWLIEAIQSSYESSVYDNGAPEADLLQQSNLQILDRRSIRNDDAGSWASVLGHIQSTVGGYFVYLENDEGDGHIIGFLNDGISIYYIDPNEGLFDLGSGPDFVQRATRHMTIQHDQDSIVVYRVGSAGMPDPSVGRPPQGPRRG